jgi:hypothetical protein
VPNTTAVLTPDSGRCAIRATSRLTHQG